MALSRLAISDHVPQKYDASTFARLLRYAENLVNNLAEGRATARYQSSAAVPTTGIYAQDDIVWKSACSEQGTAGSKYVIIGWICTAGGTPGTFKEMRVLTGN